MGFHSRAKAMTARAIRHFGDGRTVTLRKRQALLDTHAGRALSSLLIKAAAQGATTVWLYAGQKLSGLLLEATKFTVAGHALVYTVQASVVPAGVDLNPVTISPGLELATTNGQAVTISQPYVDYTFAALSRDVNEEDVDGAIARAGRVYHLTADNTHPAPESGDIVLDGAERYTVGLLQPVEPGAARVRHTFTATKGATA